MKNKEKNEKKKSKSKISKERNEEISKNSAKTGIKKKVSALTVLALIVGVSGLIFAGYAVFLQPKTEGPEGDDGDDGANGINGVNGNDGENAPGYICNTASELQAAIDEIGTGSSVITINKSITLTATIDVDAGGDYIIKGNGAVKVDCGGDWPAFNVDNVKTCTIRDLNIDAADIATNNRVIIRVRTDDSPVYIENVQIIGDADRYGIGISTETSPKNTWIQNCYFENLYYGINIGSGSSEIHIYDNNIVSCSNVGIRVVTSNYIHIAGNTISGFVLMDGIKIEGTTSNYNTIEANCIYSCMQGIYITVSTVSLHNTIANNVLRTCQNGLYIENTNYSTFTGNTVEGFYANDGGVRAGIYIWYDSCRNVFTGNLVHGYVNPNTGIGRGMYIAVSSDNNTVVGNTFLNNEYNFVDDSGTTTTSGNNT